MLPAIPVIDAREGGIVALARARPERARALRDDCIAFFPRAVRASLPLLDSLTRRWLTRSASPYVSEIAALASALGFPGVWFLNGSYQWGCTALAREEGGAPWLARTLDWPFPGLGRHVEVAQMQGRAGTFFNVVWPGYVGALSAMAPARFAACINQAPLRRRTQHRFLRVYDMAANGIVTWTRIRHIPPDQLLRQVFETCGDFADARRMLEQTPVARPVIYTLVGCVPGERCVIERTEEDFETRVEPAVANDWCDSRPGWEARIAAHHFFSLSSAQAAENSRSRSHGLASWQGSLDAEDFAWVTPPVLNPYTRIAVAMSPARGILRVQGYEAVGGGLPEPATQICTLQSREAA